MIHRIQAGDTIIIPAELAGKVAYALTLARPLGIGKAPGVEIRIVGKADPKKHDHVPVETK